jgi:hypothetical protein
MKNMGMFSGPKFLKNFRTSSCTCRPSKMINFKNVIAHTVALKQLLTYFRFQSSNLFDLPIYEKQEKV